MEWKKIEPNVWKPEKEGDEIIGVLIRSEKGGKFDSTVYHIETMNKEQKVVFGTTVLHDKMRYVKEGEAVKIIYKGTQENAKGQQVKIFEVYTSTDYFQDNPEVPVEKQIQA